MPKRSRKTQADEVESAFDVLKQIIEETEGTGKDPLAVALGRRGGLKGAKTLNARLTPAERQQSARNAATARWKHRKPPKSTKT